MLSFPRTRGLCIDIKPSHSHVSRTHCTKASLLPEALVGSSDGVRTESLLLSSEVTVRVAG